MFSTMPNKALVTKTAQTLIFSPRWFKLVVVIFLIGINQAAWAVPPATISSATYDASTGELAVTGVDMSVSDTIDVAKLTLTGRNGGTYTLTSPNVAASSSTEFSVTLNATDKLSVNGLLNQNGFAAVNGTVYNIAAASNWDIEASAPADLINNSITVSNVSAPTITSVYYSAGSRELRITGTNLVGLSGATNDVTVSLLTLTGEGGASYTLTSGDVEITSSTEFSFTMSVTDANHVGTIFNKQGTSSTSGTTYNLAAADDWNSEITGGDIADVFANTINLVNLRDPEIYSATYDATTGVFVVAGANLVRKGGAANDIDVTKIAFKTGAGSSYNLTEASSNVELD